MIAVLVTTLALGATYALVAAGLTLTWAGLGMINLAHGITYAGAGYAAWWAVAHVAPGGGVALVAAVLAGAFIGAVVCAVCFLPLDGRPNFELRTITATLAVSLIATNLYLMMFGSGVKDLPATLAFLPQLRLGTVQVSRDDVGAVVVGTVVLALLVFGMQRTRIGLSVRALTQSREGAALCGIGRTQTAFAIMIVSGALVGFASGLLGQTFYVSPDAGFVPLVKGMIVALLGGLGSLSGAVRAAFLIAFAEALTSTYLGGQYVLITLVALITIVLSVRPRGIAGVLEDSRA